MTKSWNLAQHIERSAVNVKNWPYNAKGDGSDDSDAIQAAINDCAGQFNRTVHFPAGDYYVSRPITVPNYTHITGEGGGKSRINLQGKPYTSHIFTNADPTTWGWLTIENFSFRGGSTALLNQSGSQESWTLTNVGFEIQTIAGIQSANSWQINKLVNCVFYHCTNAIRIYAGFANYNSYVNCEFNGLSREALLAIGGSCEVNNFTNCRFEAGGAAGVSTIEIANANNTNFTGCYFEGTHVGLLNQTGAGGGGTVFDQCHFTYPAPSGQYVFASTKPVLFGTNTWGRKADGPASIRITGDNGGLLGKNNKIYNRQSRQDQALVSASVPLVAGSNAVATVRLAREYTENTLNDMSVLYGELRVIVLESITGGFFGQKLVRIPVAVGIAAAGGFGVTFGTQVVDNDTSSGALVITPALTGGDTITLTISGVAANIVKAAAAWEWRSFSGAIPGYYAITADFA